MSRVGRKKVLIPAGVTVTVGDAACCVKGPRGEQTVALVPNLSIAVSEGDRGAKELVVTRSNDDARLRSLHGTIRSQIQNAVVGVTQEFQKVLEINGVGYRATVAGRNLTLNLGYSRPVSFELPKGVEASVEKQTQLSIKGCDKYLVGQVAHEIRALRKPEPYKGKGIKYKDEKILRKEGKTGKTDKK